MDVGAGGVITVTYGNQANAAINGANNLLALTPATSLNGDVSWICGKHDVPSGVTVATGATTAEPSIAQKYLPQVCRDGS